MNDKYPPLTTAALVAYNHLGPFSEVVPAEKMAELEYKLELAEQVIKNSMQLMTQMKHLHEAEISRVLNWSKQ